MKLIDADILISRIDKKIETAEKLIVSSPQDKLDKIANDAAEDFISAFGEVKDEIAEMMEEA